MILEEDKQMRSNKLLKFKHVNLDESPRLRTCKFFFSRKKGKRILLVEMFALFQLFAFLKCSLVISFKVDDKLTMLFKLLKRNFLLIIQYFI